MNEKAKKAQRMYMAKWRRNNRKKLNAYNKKWRAENPDKVKTYIENYWLKKANEIDAGKLCPVCGSEVKTKRSDAVFCSSNCRVKNKRQKTNL